MEPIKREISSANSMPENQNNDAATQEPTVKQEHGAVTVPAAFSGPGVLKKELAEGKLDQKMSEETKEENASGSRVNFQNHKRSDRNRDRKHRKSRRLRDESWYRTYSLMSPHLHSNDDFEVFLKWQRERLAAYRAPPIRTKLPPNWEKMKPASLLSMMLPDTSLKEYEPSGEEPIIMHRVAIVVDNTKFEARGRSKQIALHNVAATVCNTLFNTNFEAELCEDEMCSECVVLSITT